MTTAASNFMPRRTVRPYLLRFAVAREAQPDFPGRYCSTRDQWVVDLQDGTVAMVDLHRSDLVTNTRVGGEQADASPPSALALITTTAVGGEADDYADISLNACVTITEVGGEQFDRASGSVLLNLITLTKVEGEATDSSCFS